VLMYVMTVGTGQVAPALRVRRDHGDRSRAALTLG
jgi:hypothetical protein